MLAALGWSTVSALRCQTETISTSTNCPSPSGKKWNCSTQLFSAEKRLFLTSSQLLLNRFPVANSHFFHPQPEPC